MAKTMFGENEAHTVGELPAIGSEAPEFTLVDADLGERSLSEFRGKKVVLSIFPSVGTGVCQAALRRFNELAAGKGNTVVLCISADLPFAAKQFCAAEGIENVITLSVYRSAEFGDRYGVRLLDSPFAGLLARSIVVVDESGKVTYTELVPATGQEPDYDAAMAALS